MYLRNSFLSHDSGVGEADVCVIGIPFESTSLNAGSRFGPVAVREALKLIEGYHPESGFDVFERLKICDPGDIEVVPGSYVLTTERIRETIMGVKELNPEIFFLFLGGEHLISLPVIESLKPETIAQFDAHADLRRDYLGNRFSHATWASHVVNEFNLVQRGVRSFSREERDLVEAIKKNKVSGETYLTVDIDVFDPSVAPDTGLPEPDGWFFRDFRRNLKDIRNLVAADVVEVSPKGFSSPTALLAANVIKEILGFIAVEKR